jgi:hypothetical protein
MSDAVKGPAPYPCASCPYRRDVPSGVWHASEYAKLPPFDRETFAQPPAAFFCHQQNGHLCAGWVGCHDMDQSLGLRMAAMSGLLAGEEVEKALDYVSPIPLWSSGAEAAAHGIAEVTEPGAEAQRTIGKLVRRAERRELWGRRGGADTGTSATTTEGSHGEQRHN